MYKNHVISTKNERLTSGFGSRPNPTGAGTEQHNGADFVDAQGLQWTQDVGIIAIADGCVVEVINGSLVGWTVAISHEDKILSRYQHMKNDSVRVKVGDNVKKGQTIGIMGTTGRSTGIHLHLGIKENSTAWNNGTWVNPIPYLTGEKTIKPQETGELTMSQYNELKGLINSLTKENAELKKQIASAEDSAKKAIENNSKLNQTIRDMTRNSRILYNYVDVNMPEYARATITKMTQKGILRGNEKGELQLSEDLLRVFVILDRVGVWD